MISNLHKKIQSVSGHKVVRQKYADEIIENPELFPELLQLCFSMNEKDSYKPCWVLELVCLEKWILLENHLGFFIENLDKIKNESAIRSLSKISFLIIKNDLKPKKDTNLTNSQLEKITTVCFDWLISDTKVATKAYAMRTLFLLGNYFDWIFPELKSILEKDYEFHSAAYKAVAREILKKMDRY